MRKERCIIDIDRIQLNTGQLDWLPANPRTWTQSDIDATAASIAEDEDFLEERPLLVVPFGTEFVCFAGNLRHEGCKARKKVSAPSVIHYPETEEDRETIMRRAMKDNGSFGKTDWNAIYSSKWGTLPVEKWGLTPPSWTKEDEGEDGKETDSEQEAGSPDDYGTEFSLNDGKKAPFQQMAFTLADEQAQRVKEALAEAKTLEEYKTQIAFGNENSNGNALALIIDQWLEQRK